MRRVVGLAVVLGCLLVVSSPGRADEKEAKAIVDKAIKAMGGAEKLSKIEAFSYKTKGVFTFNGEDREMSGDATVKGLNHLRREFGNDQFHGVVVVSGDKGWRKFGDNASEIEGEGMANEKRMIYLQVIPITLVPLHGKGFKVETAGEEKVGDKPALVLKITGPDGKDFKLSFDKESGLPVKQVAHVLGFQGQEFDMETTFAGYKEYDGIKKATKLESKRDGEKFSTTELTEFKVLDKVDPKTFTEPE